MKEFTLIFRAVYRAAEAHRYQNRKGGDTPYITHPVAVGMILQKYEFPETWVAAGILHDTIEDTELTLKDIRQEFGGEVAEIVDGCSEPEHKERPWRQRKTHTIEYVKTAPYPVKIVSCADKLHNLMTSRDDLAALGESFWERFKFGRDYQAWYHRSLVDSFLENVAHQLQHEIFFRYQKIVADVFDN